MRECSRGNRSCCMEGDALMGHMLSEHVPGYAVTLLKRFIIVDSRKGEKMKKSMHYKIMIVFMTVMLSLTGCGKKYVSPTGIEYAYKLTLYENVYKDLYEYEVLTNNKDLTAEQIRKDLLSSQALTEEERGYYVLSSREVPDTEETK